MPIEWDALLDCLQGFGPLKDFGVESRRAYILLAAGLLLLYTYAVWSCARVVNHGDDKKKDKKKLLQKKSSSCELDDSEEVDYLDDLPAFPREEGNFVPGCGGIVLGNTSEQPFENHLCKGSFLAIHRATYDKGTNKSGNYPFGKYFLGKKRLWEARMQLQFKVAPKQEMFFGIELEQYVPMNAATKRSMEVMVGMLKRVVGNQIHHSPGDDPEKVDGEIETPRFVMPMWAFDQFIVTPAGEQAPRLDDDAIPDLGSCRSKREKQYQKEMTDLKFEVGPTYTFCFWGISQWLDKLNWKLMMPVLGTIDMNQFCGRPPVHVVVYTLRDDAENTGDKRHLRSNLNYFFDLAFWSSHFRPPKERVETLLGPDAARLLGARGPRPTLLETREKTSRSRLESWLACCSGGNHRRHASPSSDAKAVSSREMVNKTD